MNNDGYVLIAMDWCSDPTWNEQGSNTDYQEYPITNELKEKMRLWSEWHDSHSHMVETNDWVDYKEFYTEGVLIAQEFKRQNPSWKVWTYVHLPVPFANGQQYERVEVVLSNQIL